MAKANNEAKNIVNQLKTAQKKFQDAMKNKTLIEDVRKYADRQSRDVRKLLTADIQRVKTFVEREKKELDRLQKQMPNEIKKLKRYLAMQRRDLERLLNKARTGAKKKATKKKTAKKKTAKKTTKKKASASSSSASSSAS